MKKEQLTMAQELEKLRKPMARMFYICFAVVFSYEFLASSMMFTPFQNLILKGLVWLPLDLIEPVFKMILNLRHIIIIPAIFTIIYEVKDKNRKIILILLLLVGWFYAIYWREVEDYAVFTPLLVVVACADRDIKKIIKISLLCGSIILGLAFILSRVGVIEDLVWQRPGVNMPDRHGFGMQYCTDLASHVMFLILMYMLLKRGRLKWYAYMGIILLSVINVIYVDGKISLFCVVMAMIGCLFMTAFDKKKCNIPMPVTKVWNSLLTASFWIGAIILFGWVLIYKRDPDIWYNRYYSLQNRLDTNYRLLTQIPFSWFGTGFVQVGFGGKAERPDYYFWVDCSYPRVYAMYGIVAFLIFMSLLTWILIRLMKKKDYFGMYLMAIIAVDCMIEHHMIEIAYNTFLVLAFANLDPVLRKNGFARGV